MHRREEKKRDIEAMASKAMAYQNKRHHGSVEDISIEAKKMKKQHQRRRRGGGMA